MENSSKRAKIATPEVTEVTVFGRSVNEGASYNGLPNGFRQAHWETRLNGCSDAVRNAARSIWPTLHSTSHKEWDNKFYPLVQTAMKQHFPSVDGRHETQACADFVAWCMDVYRVLKGHRFERIVNDHSKTKSMPLTLKFLM